MLFPIFLESSLDQAVKTGPNDRIVKEIIYFNYFLFCSAQDNRPTHPGISGKIAYISEQVLTSSKGRFYSRMTENQKNEYMECLKNIANKEKSISGIETLRKISSIFSAERTEYFVRTRDNVSVHNMKFIYFAELFSAPGVACDFSGPADVKINRTDFLPEKNCLYIHIRNTETCCKLDPYIKYDTLTGRFSYLEDSGEYTEFSNALKPSARSSKPSILNSAGDLILNQECCLLIPLSCGDQLVRNAVFSFAVPPFKQDEVELELSAGPGTIRHCAVYGGIDRVMIDGSIPVPEVILVPPSGDVYQIELPGSIEMKDLEELTPFEILKLELDSVVSDLIVTEDEQQKIKSLSSDLKLSTIDYERCYRDVIFKNFFMFLLEKFRLRPVYHSDEILLFSGSVEVFRICLEFGRYFFCFNKPEDMHDIQFQVDDVIGSLSKIYDSKIVLEQVKDLGSLFEFIDILTQELKSDVDFTVVVRDAVSRFMPFLDLNGFNLSQNDETALKVLPGAVESELISGGSIMVSQEEQQVLVKLVSKNRIVSFQDKFEMVDGDHEVIVGSLSIHLSEDTSFENQLRKSLRYIRLNSLLLPGASEGMADLLDNTLDLLSTLTSTVRFCGPKVTFKVQNAEYFLEGTAEGIRVTSKTGESFVINTADDIRGLKERLVSPQSASVLEDPRDVFRRAVSTAWDDGVLQEEEMVQLHELRKKLNLTENDAKQVGEEVVLSIVQNRILNKFPGLKLEKKFYEEKKKYVYSCKILSQLFFLIEFDLVKGIRLLLKINHQWADKFGPELKPFGPVEQSWYEIELIQAGKLKIFLQVFYQAYFEAILSKVSPLVEKSGADLDQIAGLVRTKLGFEIPAKVVQDLKKVFSTRGN